eukprot:scaffold871_cov130-Cylindrotheca_fusiformis.AAC.43
MAEEAVERKKQYDKLLEDLRQEKERLIEGCLFANAEVIDLMELRHLSLTKCGLVQNSWRKQAWPKFVAAHLSIWKTTSLDYNEEEELHHPTSDDIAHVKRLVAGCKWSSKGMKKKEHSRVQHPGRQVSFHLQELAFSTDRQEDRKVLRKVLIHLKRKYPMYEPTGATCCAIAMLLAVLESSSVTSNTVQQLVAYQWTVYKLGSARLEERLLHILRTFAPQLHEHFSSFGMHNLPSTVVESWIASWFAENIVDTELLARIWDVLMVSHPECILYVTPSFKLVPEFENVLRVEKESEAIAAKILNLPAQLKDTDLEVALFRALLWMRDEPPHDTEGEAGNIEPDWFRATLAPTDYTVVTYAKELRSCRGGEGSTAKIRKSYEDRFLGGRDAIVDEASDYPLVFAAMGSPIRRYNTANATQGCTRAIIVALLAIAVIILSKPVWSTTGLGATVADHMDGAISDILDKNWTKQGKLKGGMLFKLDSILPESASLPDDTESPIPAVEQKNIDSSGLASPVWDQVSNHDRNELSPEDESMPHETNSDPRSGAGANTDIPSTTIAEDLDQKTHLLDTTETPEEDSETKPLLRGQPDPDIERETENDSQSATLVQEDERNDDPLLERSRLDAIRLAAESSRQTLTASKMAENTVSKYLEEVTGEAATENDDIATPEIVEGEGNSMEGDKRVEEQDNEIVQATDPEDDSLLRNSAESESPSRVGIVAEGQIEEETIDKDGFTETESDSSSPEANTPEEAEMPQTIAEDIPQEDSMESKPMDEEIGMAEQDAISDETFDHTLIDSEVEDTTPLLVNTEDKGSEVDTDPVGEPVRRASVKLQTPFFSQDDVAAIFEKMMASSIETPKRRKKKLWGQKMHS